MGNTGTGEGRAQHRLRQEVGAESVQRAAEKEW